MFLVEKIKCTKAFDDKEVKHLIVFSTTSYRHAEIFPLNQTTEFQKNSIFLDSATIMKSPQIPGCKVNFQS